MENINLKLVSQKGAGLFECNGVEFWVRPRSTKAFEKSGKPTKAILDAFADAKDKADKKASGKIEYVPIAWDNDGDGAVRSETEKALLVHVDTNSMTYFDGDDQYFDTKKWIPKSLLHSGVCKDALGCVGDDRGRAIFVQAWFAKKEDIASLGWGHIWLEKSEVVQPCIIF